MQYLKFLLSVLETLYYLTENMLRITQDGISNNNYSGVLELRHNTTSWGSICGDTYQPSKSELLRVCQLLGFQNIHPYVPYYYTKSHPSPMIWSSLDGILLDTICSSNQSLSIACNPCKYCHENMRGRVVDIKVSSSFCLRHIFAH